MFRDFWTPPDCPSNTTPPKRETDTPCGYIKVMAQFIASQESKFGRMDCVGRALLLVSVLRPCDMIFLHESLKALRSIQRVGHTAVHEMEATRVTECKAWVLCRSSHWFIAFVQVVWQLYFGDMYSLGLAVPCFMPAQPHRYSFCLIINFCYDSRR